MDTLNDNDSVLCVYVIQALLQRYDVNNVVNVLYFMVNKGGVKMRQSGGKCRGNRNWKSREAVRDFK
jgi:hypothetical protein